MSSWPGLRRAAVLGIVALGATACGAAMQEGSGANTHASTATEGGSVPAMTVTPGGDGESMAFPMRSFDGMTEVAQRTIPPASALPFAAAFPADAGAPMGVFVSKPADYPAGETEIVEEYDSSSPYGPFRVRESKHPDGELDQSFINGIPSVCAASCTDHRLVNLQPGIQGALLAGPDGPTSVTWLQGPYELIVIGPASTFSPDTAVAISKDVAARFAPTAANG